jgi:hypothetical protein
MYMKYVYIVQGWTRMNENRQETMEGWGMSVQQRRENEQIRREEGTGPRKNENGRMNRNENRRTSVPGWMTKDEGEWRCKHRQTRTEGVRMGLGIEIEIRQTRTRCARSDKRE